MHVTELSREELDELKYNYADERTHGCSYEELMESLDIPMMLYSLIMTILISRKMISFATPSNGR